MSDQAPDRTAQDIARDEAVRQVVGSLVYIGVMAGVSWAIMHRDALWRLRRRGEHAWRQWRRPADPYAAQVAEFRKDISNIARGTAGPPPAPSRGLYEDR